MEPTQALTYTIAAVYVLMAMIVIITEKWADSGVTARHRLVLGIFWPIVLGGRIIQGVWYLMVDLALFFKACILGK